MNPTRTAFSAFLLLASLASARRVAVFDFQCLDVDSGTARVTMVLLRDRLGDAVHGDAGYVVVAPPAGVTAYTVDEATAAAAALGADRALVGSITRLGTRLIISYKLVDVAAGTAESADRASVGSTEELDIATERIATAIREKKPFAGTGEVGKVTAAEQARTQTLSALYLTTGYTFVPDVFREHNPGPMLFTLNAAVSYETRDILTLAQMGTRRGDDYYKEVYFNILVHKVFAGGEINPYIGGGIGVHSIGFSSSGLSNDDDGISLTASGGVILFRTQYFRILAGAKGTVVFTEELGAVPMGGFEFGLTSPTVGQGSMPAGLDLPSPCITGCIGAFFLTGLIIALLT